MVRHEPSVNRNQEVSHYFTLLLHICLLRTHWTWTSHREGQTGDAASNSAIIPTEKAIRCKPWAGNKYLLTCTNNLWTNHFLMGRHQKQHAWKAQWDATGHQWILITLTTAGGRFNRLMKRRNSMTEIWDQFWYSRCSSSPGLHIQKGNTVRSICRDVYVRFANMCLRPITRCAVWVQWPRRLDPYLWASLSYFILSQCTTVGFITKVN